MADHQIHIDKLLPVGEQIRVFLQQTTVSKSDIKSILRQRGVFVNNTDKNETIPLITSTILSPKEFDVLREGHITKEDNPKFVTSVLPWNDNRSLIETLPNNFNFNDIIINQYNNYSVKGSPSFTTIGNNPNKLNLDFEIERTDLSKNWVNSKTNFKGNITIEKIDDDKVKFVFTHTAPETKALNQKAATYLKQHYKDNGCIKPESDFIKITFSSFTNEERVKFFWGLIGSGKSKILKFKDITDVDLSPDESVDLPETFEWMQKKVKGLKFKGNELHSTPFIYDDSNHKLFLFKRLEAKFDFEMVGAKGSCSINFGFPDYVLKEDPDAEFEINISGNVILDDSFKHLHKPTVRDKLLKELSDFKLLVFNEMYNSQTLSQ